MIYTSLCFKLFPLFFQPRESQNPATPSPPSSSSTSLPRRHVTVTATDVPIVAPPSRYRCHHDWSRAGRVSGVPRRRRQHPHWRRGWDTMLSASERRHQETIRREEELSFSQCNPAMYSLIAGPHVNGSPTTPLRRGMPSGLRRVAQRDARSYRDADCGALSLRCRPGRALRCQRQTDCLWLNM